MVELGTGLLSRTGIGRFALGERLRLPPARGCGRGLRRSARAASRRWVRALWFRVFAFWGLVAVGTGLEQLGWAEATFGASLTVLSTLLPLNLFGGLGFQDAGFALGFGLSVSRRALLPARSRPTRCTP